MSLRRRHAGVLAHLTSLPSHGGIGDLGRHCTEPFLKFLNSIQHSLWSLLPLCPTSDDNSPYSSRSVFAGNPILICVEELDYGGSTIPPYNNVESESHNRVDFEAVKKYKRSALQLAFEKFKLKNPNPKYTEFKSKMFWLEDYALYMAISEKEGNNFNWAKWKNEGLKYRKQDVLDDFKKQNNELVEYHKFTQFIFFEQLTDLKQRATLAGIQILGDVACYAGYESADVWANPGLFLLNPDTLVMEECAGVPGSDPTESGQWWGLPVYNWKKSAEKIKEFWIQRLLLLTMFYDKLRIDHMLGLVRFYSMPTKENPTAEERAYLSKNGKWNDAPGLEIFQDIRIKAVISQIFMEDRGPSFEAHTIKMIKRKTLLPGMAFFHEAFGMKSRQFYLPHNLDPDCFYYTSSHDDPPLRDILNVAGVDVIYHLMEYLGISKTEELFENVLRCIYASTADYVLVQMQDILPYKPNSRMNVPGIPLGQWEWRFSLDELSKVPIETIRMLKQFVKLYDRIN